ncbi:hypothetical protein [Streptomyces blastmyceticus]|uniref:Scaffolding protein n=1 Tax=Streptomyces blastmyceticus TaxID=68180 RepID=A0ABP3HQD0_9ACTN
MTEFENVPQAPQEPADSLDGDPGAEPAPEDDSAPKAGTQSLGRLDELMAERDTARAEVEQLRASIAELEARAKDAELSALRGRVAQRVGIPAELTDRLRGDSEAELEADARVLARYASAPTGGLGTGGLDPTMNGTRDAATMAARMRKGALGG